MTTILQTLQQCVTEKKNTTHSTLYTNSHSHQNDKQLVFNQATNPMENYYKTGGSLIAFIFSIVLVNTLLALFK